MSWTQQNSKRADGVLPAVTDAAAEYVLQVLQSRDVPDDVAVRLNIVDGALVLEMSEMRMDDMMFVYHDRVILLLDGRTALSLAGHTFDARQTADGHQFVLRCPGEPDII